MSSTTVKQCRTKKDDCPQKELYAARIAEWDTAITRIYEKICWLIPNSGFTEISLESELTETCFRDSVSLEVQTVRYYHLLQTQVDSLCNIWKGYMIEFGVFSIKRENWQLQQTTDKEEQEPTLRLPTWTQYMIKFTPRLYTLIYNFLLSYLRIIRLCHPYEVVKRLKRHDELITELFQRFARTSPLHWKNMTTTSIKSAAPVGGGIAIVSALGLGLTGWGLFALLAGLIIGAGVGVYNYSKQKAEEKKFVWNSKLC